MLPRPLLVQILLAECCDDEGEADGDGHKDRRGEIGIFEPSHFLKSLEDVASKPGHIIGNHNHGQSFDRMLQDDLALRRLVDTLQKREVLTLQNEINASANDRNDSFKAAS